MDVNQCVLEDLIVTLMSRPGREHLKSPFTGAWGVVEDTSNDGNSFSVQYSTQLTLLKDIMHHAAVRPYDTCCLSQANRRSILTTAFISTSLPGES